MAAKNKEIFKPNLDLLVEKMSNIELILEELVAKNVFSKEVAVMVKGAKTEKEQKRLFYEEILPCDKSFYLKLYEACRELNMTELALLLEKWGISDIKDVKVCSVKQRDNTFDRDTSKVYVMRSLPRGYMLLINTSKYSSGYFKERSLSSVDVEAVQKLWTNLGFEVIFYKDLTKAMFFDTLEMFRDMKKHENTASSVVYIMSSTEKVNNSFKKPSQSLWSTDCFEIDTQDVIDIFEGSKFKAKLGQPKLFFFQTYGCEMLLASDGVSPSHEKQYYHRETADCFIVETCAPAEPSTLEDKRSCFVQAMCKIFEEFSRDSDLVTLMEKVSMEMRSASDTCCTIKRKGFNKKLFFHPEH